MVHIFKNFQKTTQLNWIVDSLLASRDQFCQVDPEEFQDAFDRVISIEMFEHMKNYGKLHKKVSTCPVLETWIVLSNDPLSCSDIQMAATWRKAICPHLYTQVRSNENKSDWNHHILKESRKDENCAVSFSF